MASTKWSKDLLNRLSRLQESYFNLRESKVLSDPKDLYIIGIFHTTSWYEVSISLIAKKISKSNSRNPELVTTLSGKSINRII